MNLNDFHNSLLLAVGRLGRGVVKLYMGFEFLSISNKFNLENYLSISILLFKGLLLFGFLNFDAQNTLNLFSYKFFN